MGIVEFNCSNCGSPLKIDASMRKGFCQYCGTPFIYEPESKEEVVDIKGLFEKATEAERAENYNDAMAAYNKILAASPDNPEAHIGKAYASLAEINDLGEINFKYFKLHFDKGISLYKGGYDAAFHTFIMDKSWSIMPYSLKLLYNKLFSAVNAGNARIMGRYFVENSIVMYNVLMEANVIIDSSTPEGNDFYKDCYREFKSTIIAHTNHIGEKAREFGVKLDRSMVKQIKERAKITQKQLNAFNKMYKKI